jgi:glycosyltransferase involved in cell wall biosynthesis
MHIGLVIGSNQRGGAERQVSLLAQGLQRRGLRVTVFFMFRPELFQKKIDFGTVTCMHLWKTRYTQKLSLAYFSYLLKKLNISLLHMFILESIEFGAQAAQRAGLKYAVGSMRSIEFVDDSTERTRLTAVCQSIPHITCNCKAIKDLMVELDVCPANKITVINNGIVIHDAHRIPGKKPCSDKFAILFVGMLKDIKNPLLFTKAALKVLESYPKCRFIIAGDGPLRSKVEHLIQTSNWPKNFSLLGTIPLEYIPYGDVNLLVSTSKSEGSSNVILEALSHGIPVVATAVGGTVEILRGQPFGRLVQQGDIEGTAHAIKEFCLKQPDDLSNIAKQAQLFISNNYSTDHMVDEHIDFYNHFLHQS